jgi:hypothetical protein
MPAALPDDAELLYQVATWVPEGWVPLVRPSETEPDDRQMLERALLLSTTDLKLRDGAGQIVQGIDRVVDEEVRRDGLRMQLVDQMVRWMDGSTHVWRGRQKKAGLGESRAGLYFDYTAPPGSS